MIDDMDNLRMQRTRRADCCAQPTCLLAEERESGDDPHAYGATGGIDM